ncbi:MAG TPA: GNAT family N-acetyltransferase [Caulobacteraceae bacterium]|nr:GNAT family N-acetyltransferase [Caulobacteraceae bacterium]
MAGLHAQSLEDGWSEADFETLLASPGVFSLLARANDAPLGFVLVRVAADEAEILTLAVDPAFRRQGVGRALVVSAAETAAKAGAGALFLEVAEDNRPALGLYETCDFARIGRRWDYYARGAERTDALILRRALNRALAGHYARKG